MTKITSGANDPTFQKSTFIRAFEQTCKAINANTDNPISALLNIYAGRNAALDAVIRVHAPLNNAECRAGCASCCHQMVLCTPFEAMIIARKVLDTETQEDVDE